MSEQASRKPLSNRTVDWQVRDAAHHLHPFTDHAALAAKGVRVITKADGVYLWDSEGEKMLDAMAGLWCCQIGYGNDELADAGYQALKELPYYNTFFQTTHPYVVELSAKLSEITPKGIDTFFYGCSGSESNDTAVKLIRYYWNLQDRPEKKVILARDKAYHGSTTVAASLCGLPHMHTQFDLPLPGFEHVFPAPHWYGEGGDMTPDEFGLKVAEATEQEILRIGPDKVAAFIGEPVMGAGGLMIPPETYWPAVQNICRKYDILVWADEVITGFGRTGNWFGSETFGIEPDLITMAKGLSSGYQPISAIGLGARLGEALTKANEELGHGYTYSGHPVACAVALKNLEIMERLDIVGEDGRARAAYFQERLATLGDHPLVGQARGIGYLGALELVKNKATRERYPSEIGAGTVCRDFCFNNGLIMRAVGDTMILSPPLIISREEIDELVDKAQTCLDLTLERIT